MIRRSEGTDERDQLVATSRSEIRGSIAQRVQVAEPDSVAGVALKIGLLGVATEPLGLDVSGVRSCP